MIHLDEVISLMMYLIDSEKANGVYIGCTPSHPTKQQFYSLAARIDKLPEPKFIPEKLNWKIVNSERVEKELGFSFKIPNLLERLIQP